MEYNLKVIGATTTFLVLSLICVVIGHFTTIEWYKIMAVISLWYSCSASLSVVFLTEGVKTFANEIIIFLHRNVEVKSQERSSDETPG